MERIPKTRQLEDFLIDKIATKVAKSKLTKFLFAGLGVTSVSALTACDRNPPVAEAAPLPSSMATKSPYELAPTTSESIATLAPTLEPTLKPTETKDSFEGLEVCVDWKNPCPATEEDLMSGRLIDFAKSVGQPFPEEAYNTGKLGWGAGSEGTVVSFYWNDIEGQPPHPEQELYRKKGSLIVPYRWLMHFSVPYHDGKNYMVSIQQWLNPDNSISYLQYAVFDRNSVLGLKPFERLFERIGEVMPIRERYTPYDPSVNSLHAFSYRDEERVALIYEWVETKNIPEQLQYKILTPSIKESYWTKKLP